MTSIPFNLTSLDEMQNISRSKIDLFIQCPRCFWLDVARGVKRPSGPPFTLNVAVDELLKKEFDLLRVSGEAHPLMREYGIDAVVYRNDKMDEWRNNFKGVRFHHEPTDLLVFGAVDDIWISPDKRLHVVDYKATAKRGEIELTDEGFHKSYKRQIEVYQWLLRQNDFNVSDTGYFVYVNGRKDREKFDGKLEFNAKIISYTGSDSWVEPELEQIKRCLDSAEAPHASTACEFCGYRENAGSILSDKSEQGQLFGDGRLPEA